MAENGLTIDFPLIKSLYTNNNTISFSPSILSEFFNVIFFVYCKSPISPDSNVSILKYEVPISYISIFFVCSFSVREGPNKDILNLTLLK